MRREYLQGSQNADGGWGYFPGKKSWLEPTAFAALALASDPACSDCVVRAWKLIRSWQTQDGGFRPCGNVRGSSWTTALAITLAEVMGERVDAAVRWLLVTTGAEASVGSRLLRVIFRNDQRAMNHPGWPWKPETSSWVEPTAHSLVALKKVAHMRPFSAISKRIEAGEQMLLSARCADGGWNHGSSRAFGVDLPSYAESTGLALIGLQDRAPAAARDFGQAVLEQASPLGQAWLRIALGKAMDSEATALTGPADTILIALGALDPKLLYPGVRA